jgi:predicted phage-related endonuclease
VTFTEIVCEQGSPEWFDARLARLTGSRSGDMLAGGKGITRRKLLVQLVLERVTRKRQDKDFRTDAMDEGKLREDESVSAYEAFTGTLVQRSGFLSCDDLMMGCSLDGHVGGFDGTIFEAKNPLPHTHYDYIMDREFALPKGYLAQVTHNLLVTGAKRCHWVSYCPDMPENLRLKIVEVKREDVDLAAYEASARQFLAEVDAEVERLLALAGRAS